ncbi:MAG: rod shape-determining protein RodA [Endomicrobiia bacterium]
METKNFIVLSKSNKEENLIKKIILSSNWKLISSSILLSLFGLLMIWSATFYSNTQIYVTKQMIALVIGIVLLIIFSIINYQLFEPYFLYLYFLCVLILILVLLIGSTYRGTKAWIDLKFFTLQPSEIVRIIFILVLAGYFDKNWRNLESFIRFFVAAVMVSVIFLLLLLEGDFSAIVVYIPILISIFYLVEINRKILFYSILFFVFTSTLFIIKTYLSLSNIAQLPKLIKWFYTSLTGFNINWIIIILILGTMIFFIWWILKKLLFNVSLESLILTILIIWTSYSCVIISHKIIKPYQQKRIVAFLNPYFDPTGAGYQVIQTRIAIGSGKFLGKGLFNSTQGKLGFVPEKHTDFIFGLLAEEFGFIGSTIVIILYFILILESIRITQTARDTFGSIIACGISSMFSFYFLINIGMCLGLLPVVGIPLPFLSYGGSNLVASFLAVGILNSIHIRKFMY